MQALNGLTPPSPVYPFIVVGERQTVEEAVKEQPILSDLEILGDLSLETVWETNQRNDNIEEKDCDPCGRGTIK